MRSLTIVRAYKSALAKRVGQLIAQPEALPAAVGRELEAVVRMERLLSGEPESRVEVTQKNEGLGGGEQVTPEAIYRLVRCAPPHFREEFERLFAQRQQSGGEGEDGAKEETSR